MAKSIKDLRQEKGYRSAREFADALGIATSSLSRYDKQPETIPMKHAWAMADALDCSIDEVVGRAHVTSGASELQEFYDGLLPETRELMDEFIQFVSMKDQATRDRRAAEEDAKYDRICQAHERMFHQWLYDSADFGQISTFEDAQAEREAFLGFLRKQAAEKRKPGIDLHCEGVEEELRGGYIDEDGTERQFSEEYIQNWLAEERAQMDEEFGKKDEGVIAKIMAAYDRIHARGSMFGPVTVEYSSVRLEE